jgi:hypothetical protein
VTPRHSKDILKVMQYIIVGFLFQGWVLDELTLEELTTDSWIDED